MSENSPPAFQFYPKDFLTDTMAMPAETLGVYITLLCYAWINGGIPESHHACARICGMTPDEMAVHLDTLSDKFVKNDEPKGTLVNPRMERERQKQQRFRAKQAAAGRKSGKARRNQKRTKSNPSSSSSSSTSVEDNSPTGSSLEHPFGDRAVDDDKPPPKPKPKATSPPCPIQKILEMYHEHCPLLPQVRVMTERRKKALRTRWNEDKKRQVLEWWLKYFKYINEQPFLNGENDRSWTADFDFVTRQSALVNIIEGKYER